MDSQIDDEIEKLAAVGTAVLAERARLEALAVQQKQAAVLVELEVMWAEPLATIRDAVPVWVWDYILPPTCKVSEYRHSDDGGSVYSGVQIELPGIALIMAFVTRDGVRFSVADPVIWQADSGQYLVRWTQMLWRNRYEMPDEDSFPVALVLASEHAEAFSNLVDRAIELNKQPEPAQPKPSKWAALDPTRKSLEAIDNGEYAEAQAFGLVAVARELRTIGQRLSALAQPAAELTVAETDNCGDF